ncbi:MAG: M1 family metallopeptidase [Akkermansiaceae bacterium]
MRTLTIITLFLGLAALTEAHPIEHHDNPFRQLDEVLPTPTDTRTASGAPGHAYWQQQVDYDMAVTLDEEKHTLFGDATITYHNNSPDTLTYLWIQLDRNRHHPNAPGHQSTEAPDFGNLNFERFRMMMHTEEFDGAYKIRSVTDVSGNKIPYIINQTMMRLDLATPLKPGTKQKFKIEWRFAINNRLKSWARSGFEIFPKDGNALYQMAQFFPRLASYTDVNGWQNKQFLGRGEFALEFGNYQLALTVPADHIVASTGTLQNPEKVLSQKTRARLKEAEVAKKPVFIVNREEAETALKNKPGHTKDTKTWVFHAKNVRDFAFATSRRFIWDAVLHPLPNSDKKVWAMSYYPPEAEPLWSQYSTAAVVHTLNVYSRYTFDYPYPAAISVHGKIWGMEYPMLSFNGGRPEEDGTYTEKLKKSLISVIIHEVGHNWFPMIVNSDERQWTWMDEGINSFIQILAEEQWDAKPYNVPTKKENIITYMKSPNQRPIMTNSESILQFGPNAYRKPATALLYLRESVMGRELFDHAFKEYSNRWRFKRPEPADFFRTMEDASGIDLDWFWQGWFYTTDHLDVALGEIIEYQLETGSPAEAKARKQKDHEKEKAKNLTHQRNKNHPKFTNGRSELRDFYDDFDPFKVTEAEQKKFDKKAAKLTEEDRALWNWKGKRHFYQITLQNKGGLVAPVHLELTLEGGKKEQHKLPAEIWKKNHKEVRKLLITQSPLKKVTIDPQQVTHDANTQNNSWPREIEKKPFILKSKEKKKNPMQKAKGETDEEEDE